ncbi:hypothetical protein [uncultured Duncaniella sp.]|jgi:hypothetical protein|uniref:hypothetical protein n=1 Tax=uncultured Duncaniella sp. TaxID=2768039 RepID=UPI0026F2E5AB|nr:hypothetical protein [uncultured Duncaniella sp.]
MKTLEKIQRGLGKSVASLASLVKIVLMSRRPTGRCRDRKDTIIIMGNGPSLRDAMEHDMDVLKAYPRMAVNLSALAPEFRELRPDYYILADIAFFLKVKTGKVPALWEALAGVDWPMTLFLPATARGMAEVRRLPGNVTVKYYNLTPAEGFGWLMRPVYDMGLAMPRPRNVLIPSIMSAMREGFRRVVLIGADHNWSKTLWVTERNCVVSVQPHFYKDDDKELRRAEEIFRNVRIHDVYENYAIAFRSYHNLKAYTDRRGVEVLNATPGSFIDAFPRTTLRHLKDEN